MVYGYEDKGVEDEHQEENGRNGEDIRERKTNVLQTKQGESASNKERPRK